MQCCQAKGANRPVGGIWEGLTSNMWDQSYIQDFNLIGLSNIMNNIIFLKFSKKKANFAPFPTQISVATITEICDSRVLTVLHFVCMVIATQLCDYKFNLLQLCLLLLELSVSICCFAYDFSTNSFSIIYYAASTH